MHAMRHGIPCVGVNANEWQNINTRKRRRLESSGGHRILRRAKPAPPPKPTTFVAFDQSNLEAVQAALRRGADRAAAAAMRAAGANSSLAPRQPVAFTLDLGREPGAYGNALQMRLAAASPLLVTEAGTQWSDVILFRRSQRGLPR